MTLNNYIQRSMQRKNSGIYFRKGRWVLHVFFIVITLLSNTWRLSKGPEIRKDDDITIIVTPSSSEKAPEENAQVSADADLSKEALAASALKTAPFIIFFYFYCLYLIPYCFKRNRVKRFWILLALCLALFPLAEILLVYVLHSAMPLLARDINEGFLHTVARTYSSFIGSFMGFTTLLFLMELLEGVRTRKETENHEAEIDQTALSKIKMQISPGFMIGSLDQIADLSEQNQQQAPDAIIAFSDLLRYRLYRSKAHMVFLREELQQLQQLFNFQNNIFSRQCCTLEYEGAPDNAGLPPLALINIAEPLLNLAKRAEDWNFLFYILVEETEMQIAVEYDTPVAIPAEVFETIQIGLNLMFGQDIIFAIEQEHNNYSLRVCLPLLRHSNALS